MSAMAKSAGTVLGIIGILLGAGGLGFGVISWFSIGQVPIQQSWHDSVESSGLSSTRQDISDLSITMTLGAGQSIYVSFTCTVECSGYWVYLYIYIDNLFTGDQIKISRDGVAGYLYYSASIQHINNTLTAGAHSITVWAQTDDVGSIVRDCVLFVRTL